MTYLRWVLILPRLFSEAARSFLKHKGIQNAAVIAYFGTLSLIPFFVLLISGAGFAFHLLGPRYGSEEEMVAVLRRGIKDIIPYYADQIVARIRDIVHARQTIGVLGGIFLFLSSALVFDAVRGALKEIFESQGTRHFLISRLLFFLFFFGIGSLFFVTYLLLALTKPILASIGEPSLFSLISKYRLLDYLLSFLLIGGGFAIVLRYFTGRRIHLLALFSGSLLFLLLFALARWAFGYYVGHIARLDLLYGSLASLMIGIIWIYYSAAIFLFSAEFSRSVEKVLEDASDRADT